MKELVDISTPDNLYQKRFLSGKYFSDQIHVFSKARYQKLEDVAGSFPTYLIGTQCVETMQLIEPTF